MKNLKFSISERERRRLTAEQQKRVKEIYRKAAHELQKKAANFPKDKYERKYIKEMLRLLEMEINTAGADVEKLIKKDILRMSETVAKENADIWKKYGLDISGSVVSLPEDIVETLVSGQLYESSWNLSESIWGADKKINQTIQEIAAKGAAADKSAYEIAKDVEKYVDPNVKKQSRVIEYKGRDGRMHKFYFGQVDYYAQRLARTMISHAYQESFVRTTRKNPFVTAYRWLASNSRPCPICLDRDGRLFQKDDLPLDHPNGMCTFEAVIEESDDEITDRILRWRDGGSDSALDAYAADMTERYQI